MQNTCKWTGSRTGNEALDADACARWLPLSVGAVDAPPLLVVRCVVKHHLRHSHSHGHCVEVHSRRLIECCLIRGPRASWIIDIGMWVIGVKQP